MASLGAFSRTRLVLAKSKSEGVNFAMTKWWGKYGADEGQIIRHLSPMETLPVAPWLMTFPKKAMERSWDYIVYVGGAFGLGFGVIHWTKTSDYNKGVAEERD